MESILEKINGIKSKILQMLKNIRPEEYLLLSCSILTMLFVRGYLHRPYVFYGSSLFQNFNIWMTDLYLYPVIIIILVFRYNSMQKQNKDRSHTPFLITVKQWARDLLLFFMPLNDYCNLKGLVPYLRPNVNYDQELWKYDKICFFGYSPTEWMHSISNPFLDRMFDSTYSYVFPGLLILGITIYLTLGRVWFRRFLFSYGLTYHLGLIGYFAYPSLGPLFTHHDLYFSDRNMSFINNIYKMLIYDRHFFLQNPLNYRFYFAAGIAAFPSLHVSHYFIFVLFARFLKRKWVFPVVFILFILAYGATIYVGMHYFLDGIGGIAITLAAYYAALWMIKEVPHE